MLDNDDDNYYNLSNLDKLDVDGSIEENVGDVNDICEIEDGDF